MICSHVPFSSVWWIDLSSNWTMFFCICCNFSPIRFNCLSDVILSLLHPFFCSTVSIKRDKPDFSIFYLVITPVSSPFAKINLSSRTRIYFLSINRVQYPGRAPINCCLFFYCFLVFKFNINFVLINYILFLIFMDNN